MYRAFLQKYRALSRMHTSGLHWSKSCQSMAAVGFDSSFGSLLCTLSTRHLDPVTSCESPYQTPWRSRTLQIACTTLGVSVFATILHSRTLARAAHSTKSPVRVGHVYQLCYMCWRTLFLINHFGIELYRKRLDLIKDFLFDTFLITVWNKLCHCDNSVLEFESFSTPMNCYPE